MGRSGYALDKVAFLNRGSDSAGCGGNDLRASSNDPERWALRVSLGPFSLPGQVDKGLVGHSDLG